MISLNINIKVPKVNPRSNEILKKYREGVIYAAVVAYANAAAAAVPLWTGYTRSIWLGVARKASRMATNRGITPPAITIDLAGAEPWFFPPRPVSRPNYGRVLDSPSDQKRRGLRDSADVLEIENSDDGVAITFTIPSYTGEENYEIREDEVPWDSLPAGRIAFARALKTITRLNKIKGLVING